MCFDIITRCINLCNVLATSPALYSLQEQMFFCIVWVPLYHIIVQKQLIIVIIIIFFYSFEISCCLFIVFIFLFTLQLMVKRICVKFRHVTESYLHNWRFYRICYFVYKFRSYLMFLDVLFLCTYYWLKPFLSRAKSLLLL